MCKYGKQFVRAYVAVTAAALPVAAAGWCVPRAMCGCFILAQGRVLAHPGARPSPHVHVHPQQAQSGLHTKRLSSKPVISTHVETAASALPMSELLPQPLQQLGTLALTSKTRKGGCDPAMQVTDAQLSCLKFT